MDIDAKLTCIVGANESGKSQFLDAIECALGRREAQPADLCRYSDYFLRSDGMRSPDTGLHFESLTVEESSGLHRIIRRTEGDSINSFRVFRTHPNKVVIYVENETDPVDVSGQVVELDDFLPNVVRIEPDRALPDSVSIEFLASGNGTTGLDAILRPTERRSLIEHIMGMVPTNSRRSFRCQHSAGDRSRAPRRDSATRHH